MHDEFVQLLVEGLVSRPRSTTAASSGTSDSAATAAAAAAATVGEGAEVADLQQQQRAIYRRKLQTFLLASAEYNPQRVLKLLSPAAAFRREQALVESRLSEHESVLVTYVHRLRDPRLAEWYCDRVYTAFQLSSSGSGSGTAGSSRTTSGNDTRVSFSAMAAGATAAASSSPGPGSSGGSSAGGAATVSVTGAGLNALVRRDDGIVSGLRDGGDIYLTLFKVGFDRTLVGLLDSVCFSLTFSQAPNSNYMHIFTVFYCCIVSLASCCR